MVAVGLWRARAQRLLVFLFPAPGHEVASDSCLTGWQNQAYGGNTRNRTGNVYAEMYEGFDIPRICIA
jgi:hypothetical protein